MMFLHCCDVVQIGYERTDFMKEIRDARA